MSNIKLEQFNMPGMGLPKAELVQTWSQREAKPWDAQAWHQSLDPQWLPDWQGPVQPQTSEKPA